MGLCDGLNSLTSIASVLTWLKENASLIILGLTIIIIVIMLMRL